MQTFHQYLVFDADKQEFSLYTMQENGDKLEASGDLENILMKVEVDCITIYESVAAFGNRLAYCHCDGWVLPMTDAFYNYLLGSEQYHLGERGLWWRWEEDN